MPNDFDHEINRLRELTAPELRARYAQLFGDTVRTGHKRWLIKRLAWRLQALAEGDLSQRARQRANELANDADLRLAPPRIVSPRAVSPRFCQPLPPVPRDPRLPPPGSILTRLYKGQTLQIEVLEHGFAFQGQTFPSLSALSKKITGTHCNGLLFFRLGQYGEPA